MKGQEKSIHNGSFLKEKSQSGSQTQKKSARVGKDSLNSPKKQIYYQKAKQSHSHIDVSYRQSESNKINKKNNESMLKQKKQKKDGFDKNDKRCIQPTEKIIERINKNLRLLEGKIGQLFSSEFKGKEEQKQQEVVNTKLVGQSLLIKKNGSTLSLTKNSSKKRLQGRLTHDGMRSDRKNIEVDKSSKISQQPGWK